MLLTTGFKLWAKFSKRRFNNWNNRPDFLQEKLFQNLIANGRKTLFGKEHEFDKISDYEGFKQQVPIRDYRGLEPYISKIRDGVDDVLWPGKPLYFSKTSGTTSGAKYIPITKASMPYHINSARQALLMYILKTGNTDFLQGSMIFVSGSPELDHNGSIPTGRLSGIVHHHVPNYINRRKLPGYETNCIADWEEKLNAIVGETMDKNMSLISGIPPWVEMYFERLLAHSGKSSVSELFPGFSLFVYGGVNFEPYRRKFNQLMGKEIPSLETFPASEGFIAFQDEWPSQGLLLLPDSGIFYEFIPADKFDEDNPPRFRLSEVRKDVNYVMILNTNAGLWGYNIGDTVRFVSTSPYRFIPTGRLSHFTSAFGEHVIAEEAESAMAEATRECKAIVNEFTLAPLVENPDGLPCHQWFVEFKKEPEDIKQFAVILDQALQEKNPYYKDLVTGSILQKAIVKAVPKDTFRAYMKSIGKLGGQNKVPHLSNDRKIADWILENIKD